MRSPVGANASQFLKFSTVFLAILLVNWVGARRARGLWWPTIQEDAEMKTTVRILVSSAVVIILLGVCPSNHV
jgi:hypothetical protein